LLERIESYTELDEIMAYDRILDQMQKEMAKPKK
jgi:hypothetical protein